MSIWQAIIIGGIYWLSHLEVMYSVYGSIMEPLFLCGFVGLALGDMRQGMIVGAYIQPMYLVFLGAGGTAAVDKPAAGIIPAAAVNFKRSSP